MICGLLESRHHGQQAIEPLEGKPHCLSTASRSKICFSLVKPFVDPP